MTDRGHFAVLAGCHRKARCQRCFADAALLREDRQNLHAHPYPYRTILVYESYDKEEGWERMGLLIKRMGAAA